MALQMFIDTLDQVDAALRPHYERVGGRYRLAFDGLDKLKNELTRRHAAGDRIRELETELATLRAGPDEELTPLDRWIHEQAKRLAPFESGSPEWQAEFAKIEAEMDAAEPIRAEIAAAGEKYEQRLASMTATLRRETLRAAAHDLARDLARDGCTEALMPSLMQRIGVEQRGDEFVAVALDASGKSTSFDAIKEEFRQTPAFAPVVRGAAESEKADHARRVAEMIH